MAFAGSDVGAYRGSHRGAPTVAAGGTAPNNADNVGKAAYMDANGKLMPRFITISNIQSKDAEQVIAGNEKVIRPRLADAAFFYDNDCKKTLAQHGEGLANVVFQQQLGTVADKCQRIGALAAVIAEPVRSTPYKCYTNICFKN